MERERKKERGEVKSERDKRQGNCIDKGQCYTYMYTDFMMYNCKASLRTTTQFPHPHTCT